MKKEYSKPVAQKVDFCYDEQVVASNVCRWFYSNIGETCHTDFDHNTST